jgi:hypothetical protein
MSKVISILTPTRQRPNRLSEFVMSVYQHTEEKDRVGMLIHRHHKLTQPIRSLSCRRQY